MSCLRIIVVGTMAGSPFAGMAWMNMQLAAGFRRLGHDAYYFETTSNWPYDPLQQCKVCDANYAVGFLADMATRFGLVERWAYRRSYDDKAWIGMERQRAEALLKDADVVFNVTGATRFREEGLRVGRLVYLGTDPVYHEVTYASGDEETRSIIDEHDDTVTYGENIGRPDCLIPPLPRLRAVTRQPVLLDFWKAGPPTRPEFTTVGNWKQEGREIQWQGETYLWSKHHEFLKIIDLPRRTTQPIELAMNLARPETIRYGRGEPVKAWGVAGDDAQRLESYGWQLADAREFTLDPWPYRDYVRASRGEFTVARDLNVRLRSGWFSERSACYLAAGRPVITQDTGFGVSLPTGRGLFGFQSMDDILAAFDAVNSNYDAHSRAATEIAAEYFATERVLPKLLTDLGL